MAGSAASVEEAAVEAHAREDDKYVLRTTTSLPADEVAQAYKQLSAIERLWRELKDVVEVRPVFHHWKRENVKDHIFVCLLTLYVATHLKHKLAAAGHKLPWDDVPRDLCQVRAITIRVHQDRYLMCSPFKGTAGKVFTAVGVRPPVLAEAL